MLECIAGPPAFKTLAGWCRVFHQSTENFMMGTFTNPTKAKIAEDMTGILEPVQSALIAAGVNEDACKPALLFECY